MSDNEASPDFHNLSDRLISEHTWGWGESECGESLTPEQEEHREAIEHGLRSAYEAGEKQSTTRVADLERRLAVANAERSELSRVCGCLEPNDGGQPSCNPPCIACRNINADKDQPCTSGESGVGASSGGTATSGGGSVESSGVPGVAPSGTSGTPSTTLEVEPPSAHASVAVDDPLAAAIAELEDWRAGRKSWTNLGPCPPYTPDVIAAMDAQEVVKISAYIQAHVCLASARAKGAGVPRNHIRDHDGTLWKIVDASGTSKHTVLLVDPA